MRGPGTTVQTEDRGHYQRWALLRLQEHRRAGSQVELWMRVVNLVIDGVDKKARGYERVISGYPAIAAGVRRYPDRDRVQKNRPHIHWRNLLSRHTIGGENHSIQIEFLQSCVDPIGTGESAISLDGLVILVIDGPGSCSMQSGRVSSALRQRDKDATTT